VFCAGHVLCASCLACLKHSFCLSVCLSLRFNGHFPRGPGLADTRMSPFWMLLELRMMEVVVTAGAVRRAKFESNCYHQQTNTQLFTGWMSFLSPNQQCRSRKGNTVLWNSVSVRICQFSWLLFTADFFDYVVYAQVNSQVKQWVSLTCDLLTLKVVSESHVTWATSVEILVFLDLSVLDLGPMYVTNRQTDRRQTASSLNAPAY